MKDRQYAVLIEDFQFLWILDCGVPGYGSGITPTPVRLMTSLVGFMLSICRLLTGIALHTFNILNGVFINCLNCGVPDFMHRSLWHSDIIVIFSNNSQPEIVGRNCAATGCGFASNASYLYGFFSMELKLVAGDSSGTITSFYVGTESPFICDFALFYPVCHQIAQKHMRSGVMHCDLMSKPHCSVNHEACLLQGSRLRRMLYWVHIR